MPSEEQQPLYLDITGKNFVETNDGKIVINKGEIIKFYCDSDIETAKVEETTKCIAASCKGGTNFQWRSKSIDFKDIKCVIPKERLHSRHTIKTTGDKTIYKIGFNVESAFIPLMTVKHLHNENLRQTLWTHHTLTPQNSFEKTRPVTKFVDNTPNLKDTERFDFNTRYQPDYQKEKFKTLLGKEMNWISSNESAKKFFSRGHFVPASVFIFPSQQKMTFEYINVAPQWQKFNGENWADMEHNLLAVVKRKSINKLDVYTGTYGILKVKNSSGALIDIKFDSLPVPKYYYKILLDLKSEKGVAVLGLNSCVPQEEIDIKMEIEEDELVDISDNNKFPSDFWPKTAKEPTKGYLFACPISTLFHKIRNDYPDNHILGSKPWKLLTFK